MRCATCGNGNQLPPFTTCRVCGNALPPNTAKATARTASGWRDPKAWKRHLLVRLGSPPIELKKGEEWRIGRSSECQVRIQSPRVSRQHAAIIWPEGADGPSIRDLGSQNGILVDGRPVKEHAFKDGDELTIGPFVCNYRRVDGIGSTTELQDLLDSQADTQEVATTAMSGRLQELSLHELLETLSYNQRSGTVEVYGPWGDEGKVALIEGEALWAELDQLKGKAALEALLEWTEGMFRFTGTVVTRTPDADLPPLQTRLEESRRRMGGTE